MRISVDREIFSLICRCFNFGLRICKARVRFSGAFNGSRRNPRHVSDPIALVTSGDTFFFRHGSNGFSMRSMLSSYTGLIDKTRLILHENLMARPKKKPRLAPWPHFLPDRSSAFAARPAPANPDSRAPATCGAAHYPCARTDATTRPGYAARPRSRRHCRATHACRAGNG
jgi:hypothetical protein